MMLSFAAICALAASQRAAAQINTGAENERVGSCDCSNGEKGMWYSDNACHAANEGGAVCAPPAGRELHTADINAGSMVSSLPNVEQAQLPLPGFLRGLLPDFDAKPQLGFLVNQLNPSQCLDVMDGTPGYLQMHDCEFDRRSSQTDQIWKFHKSGFIESVKYPGRCIDVPGNPSTTAIFSTLTLQWCEFGRLTDQQWVLATDGYLQNRLNTSRCLDVAGEAQHQVDSAIVINTCHSASDTSLETDQKWLVKAADVELPDVTPRYHQNVTEGFHFTCQHGQALQDAICMGCDAPDICSQVCLPNNWIYKNAAASHGVTFGSNCGQKGCDEFMHGGWQHGVQFFKYRCPPTKETVVLDTVLTDGHDVDSELDTVLLLADKSPFSSAPFVSLVILSGVFGFACCIILNVRRSAHQRAPETRSLLALNRKVLDVEAPDAADEDRTETAGDDDDDV